MDRAIARSGQSGGSRTLILIAIGQRLFCGRQAPKCYKLYDRALRPLPWMLEVGRACGRNEVPTVHAAWLSQPFSGETLEFAFNL
mmetsp:Transcript_80333/g.208760  ORF Transcript_80333/g.208760 Transcript_80333/m.208760 type:complete len:85 (-) Transcript_80333:51-305(-)